MSACLNYSSLRLEVKVNRLQMCVIVSIVFLATCVDLLGAADYTISIIPTGNVIPAGGPSINNAGTIVFAGSKADGTTGIYTYSGNTLSTVVDSTGPLSAFAGPPVINNNGHIAFTASLFNGQNAIFLAAPQSNNSPILSN